MTRYLYLSALVVVLILTGLGALFWVQNSSRTTQLSLELWAVGAWQLAEPMSVPVLIAIALVSGLLIAGVPLGLLLLSAQRKVGALQQQVAVHGGGTDWRR